MQLLNLLCPVRSRHPLIRVRLLVAAVAGLGVGTLQLNLSAQPAAPGTAPAGIAAPADAAPQNGVGEAEARDARLVTAQRMAKAASDIVQGDQTGRNTLAWRQAVAFLEAAHQLDPAEPRYPRLLVDAYAQLGDVDASAESLEAYLKLRGDDDISRLRLIEYYVAKMQTVDAKLKYLTSLLEKESVSNELKSRCATFAAVLLGERSVRQQVQMTDKALELDPLNIYARRLEYAQLLAVGANPPDRLRSLFAQLRCNPAQVSILESIGRELAAAGLTRDALDWLASAKNMSLFINQPDPNFFVEYSAQLYINGLNKEAEEAVGLVLQADPGNLDAWFLLLTLRKAAGLQVAYDQDLDRARTVFAGRAGTIAGRIEAETGAAATTKPAGTPDIDFSSAFAPTGGAVGNVSNDGPAAAAPTGQRLNDVVARLKKPDAPAQLKAEFIGALSDLAWFEIYYNRSAASGRAWLDALSALVPPDDVILIRLRGWFELLENRQAEAMKTLWAIRDLDPLAAMGVSRMLGEGNWTNKAASQPTTRPASQDPIKTAQALLNRYPTGLLGAVLTTEFKDRKLKVEPAPYAEEMKRIVTAFPVDLLQILVQAERFYVPVGSAISTPYRLGEPMLANFSIRNLSEYDLPIGNDGIIKPDLWFDARVSVGVERTFPTAAYDRIAGPLVLKARGTTSQTVHVDHGQMAETLRERPSGSVNVYMTVMTNPMIRQDSRVVPGPCGVRRQFSRSLIRGGMAIYSEPQKKKLLNGLKGLPNEKIWTIDVLAAMVEQSRGPDAEENVQRAAPDFIEQIRTMQSDRVPEVSIFATCAMLRVVDPKQVDERARLVETLAASKLWEGRLTAVHAARLLPAAERKRIVAPLANDANELVKQAAAADLKLADIAATQPATRPTGPTPQPGNNEGPALPQGLEGPKLDLPGQ